MKFDFLEKVGYDMYSSVIVKKIYDLALLFRIAPKILSDLYIHFVEAIRGRKKG